MPSDAGSFCHKPANKYSLMDHDFLSHSVEQSYSSAFEVKLKYNAILNLGFVWYKVNDTDNKMLTTGFRGNRKKHSLGKFVENVVEKLESKLCL